MRVEIGCDVARLRLRYAARRHRDLGRKGLRINDEADQIFGSVGCDAADVDSGPQIFERTTDFPVAARNSRDSVTAAAAITPDQIRRPRRVTRRDSCGNAIGLLLTPPPHPGGNHCNRDQADRPKTAKLRVCITAPPVFARAADPHCRECQRHTCINGSGRNPHDQTSELLIFKRRQSPLGREPGLRGVKHPRRQRHQRAEGCGVQHGEKEMPRSHAPQCFDAALTTRTLRR